jgi:hypothetical protein
MDVFCYPSDCTMVTVVPRHPCTHELAGVFARYEQSEPLLPCQTRVRQEKLATGELHRQMPINASWNAQMDGKKSVPIQRIAMQILHVLHLIRTQPGPQ